MTLHRSASAKTEAFEYITGTAEEAIVIGEGLVLASGKLTKVAATATPEFIAMGPGTGTIIPVKRVYEDEVFESKLSADGSALNIGDKVTIHTDGVKVTATKTSGVATITEILESGAIGTIVRVMFRR